MNVTFEQYAAAIFDLLKDRPLVEVEHSKMHLRVRPNARMKEVYISDLQDEWPILGFISDRGTSSTTSNDPSVRFFPTLNIDPDRLTIQIWSRTPGSNIASISWTIQDELTGDERGKMQQAFYRVADMQIR